MSLEKSLIRTQTHQLLGNDSQIIASDLNSILEAENDTILEAHQWSRRKSDTIVNLIATYESATDTTIGITLDGTTVTSDGSDDTVFTSGMVGRYIRIDGDNTYHKISTFTSATSIEIESSWPKTTVAAGAFSVFQNKYVIATDCDSILSIHGDNVVVERSRQWLDRQDPDRDSTTADYPYVYAYAERDSNDDIQIEVWPIPTTAQMLRINYIKSGLIASETSKPLYPSELLKWKSAITGCYFLLAKTGEPTWKALAKEYDANYTKTLNQAVEEDRLVFGATRSQTQAQDSFRYDQSYIQKHITEGW